MLSKPIYMYHTPYTNTYVIMSDAYERWYAYNIPRHSALVYDVVFNVTAGIGVPPHDVATSAPYYYVIIIW